MDGPVRTALWCTCMTIALHGAMVVCFGLPMLNDEDIRITNLTDTSVVIAWRPVKIFDLSQYRLMVAYKRQGYNTRYMEAGNSDPECSLRLSYCRLTALLPDTLYSVTISIDHRGNNTLQGRADLFFSTLSQSNEKDLQWWLMFVVAPVTGGLILLIIIIIIIIVAKCYGCCCWSKRAPIHQHASSFNSTSSSSRHVLRSESHATREWVQDTFRTIQPDPPSTYDRPCVHSPTLSPSQRDPHSYLQMYELSVPRSTPPMEPRSPVSCQTCLPFPGRQKAWQEEKQAGQREQTAQKPANYLNVSSDAGENGQTTLRHDQGTEHQLPNRQCPPLQPPRKGKQDQVIYANTEDVNKLLGSAKKMFPML